MKILTPILHLFVLVNATLPVLSALVSVIFFLLQAISIDFINAAKLCKLLLVDDVF